MSNYEPHLMTFHHNCHSSVKSKASILKPKVHICCWEETLFFCQHASFLDQNILKPDIGTGMMAYFSLVILV